MVSSVSSTAATRIAGKLLDLTRAEEVVAVTRQELADLAGTTVETAIRVTRVFEDMGTVRLSLGCIEIISRSALEEAPGR